MTEFKVNDWIIYEAEIWQIKEIDNFGFSLSDGYVRTGTSLQSQKNMFLLTSKNKPIVNHFHDISQNIHKLCGWLNYPRIHDYISELCAKCCRASTPQEANQLMDRGDDFYNKLKEKIIELEKFRIDDIDIFGRN